MKQLDIEQAEEMPSSTLTSAEGIASCHIAPMLPQRLHITSDTSIEEGEIVAEADMPPLTGRTTLNSMMFANRETLLCDRHSICSSDLRHKVIATDRWDVQYYGI